GALRHYPDPPLGLHLLPPHVELADEHAPAGGPCARGEDADGGALARTVRPQQPEDLTGADFERDAVERPHFHLLLFVLLLLAGGALGREGEAAPPGRRGRRRIVDLAQILDANSDSHRRPPTTAPARGARGRRSHGCGQRRQDGRPHAPRPAVPPSSARPE